MGAPTATLRWCFKTDDAHARRGDGFVVEVVGSMEAVPSGSVWTERRGAHEVECEFSLWDKEIPHVHIESGIDCAKNRDEMVLPGTDATLGLAGAVIVWRYILNLDRGCVVSTILFEKLGSFIVQPLILGDDAMRGEEIGATAVRFDVLGSVARAQGLGMDVVAADHDHVVLCATFRRCGEAPGEIGVPEFVKRKQLGIYEFNVRNAWDYWRMGIGDIVLT